MTTSKLCYFWDTFLKTCNASQFLRHFCLIFLKFLRKNVSKIIFLKHNWLSSCADKINFVLTEFDLALGKWGRRFSAMGALCAPRIFRGPTFGRAFGKSVPAKGVKVSQFLRHGFPVAAESFWSTVEVVAQKLSVATGVATEVFYFWDTFSCNLSCYWKFLRHG